MSKVQVISWALGGQSIAPEWCPFVLCGPENQGWEARVAVSLQAIKPVSGGDSGIASDVTACFLCVCVCEGGP